MKQNDNGRREFLAAGLTAGLAAIGCNSKSDVFTPEDATVKPSGKMVKLLSSDARKAATAPISDGSAMRWSGVIAAKTFWPASPNASFASSVAVA